MRQHRLRHPGRRRPHLCNRLRNAKSPQHPERSQLSLRKRASLAGSRASFRVSLRSSPSHCRHLPPNHRKVATAVTAAIVQAANPVKVVLKVRAPMDVARVAKVAAMDAMVVVDVADAAEVTAKDLPNVTVLTLMENHWHMKQPCRLVQSHPEIPRLHAQSNDQSVVLAQNAAIAVGVAANAPKALNAANRALRVVLTQQQRAKATTVRKAKFAKDAKGVVAEDAMVAAHGRTAQLLTVASKPNWASVTAPTARAPNQASRRHRKTPATAHRQMVKRAKKPANVAHGIAMVANAAHVVIVPSAMTGKIAPICVLQRSQALHMLTMHHQRLIPLPQLQWPCNK